MNRHTRWGKLRWKIGGFRYVSELVGNPVFMASLPVMFWEANHLSVISAVLVAIFKILGDYLLSRKINGAMTPSSYLLVPVKDIIIGLIWFVPLVSRTVMWRGNRYLIGHNSSLSPCPESAWISLRYRLADVILAKSA